MAASNWKRAGWKRAGWKKTGWKMAGWKMAGWNKTGWKKTGAAPRRWTGHLIPYNAFGTGNRRRDARIPGIIRGTH
jgi:hypothetical protein